jgi:hypothetical protein
VEIGCCVHLDRIAGGHHHHRHPGGATAAGLGVGKQEGAGGDLLEQPEAIGFSLDHVL